MNIIEDLNELLQKQQEEISDLKLLDELSRLGVDQELIEELLLDPVEKRQYFLDYFRNKK